VHEGLEGALAVEGVRLERQHQPRVIGVEEPAEVEIGGDVRHDRLPWDVAGCARAHLAGGGHVGRGRAQLASRTARS
jgi:hypothetical protein